MIQIDEFIPDFSSFFGKQKKQSWEIIATISTLVTEMLSNLSSDYLINGSIAIHKTAIVESNVIVKSPAIIGANCFIGANSYLRGGVLLMDNIKIGTGCEIKSSIIFPNSAIAHFNFIGDSIIGNNVNFEAGSITANHYNEREDKRISVLYNSEIIVINTLKFGAMVGNNSKIGANAVLSPGTILNIGSNVKRLELIEQIKA